MALTVIPEPEKGDEKGRKALLLPAHRAALATASQGAPRVTEHAVPDASRASARLLRRAAPDSLLFWNPRFQPWLK